MSDDSIAVEGSDHYYLVTEPGNISSIPPITLIENMTYCFNEDVSAYIRLTFVILCQLLVTVANFWHYFCKFFKLLAAFVNLWQPVTICDYLY